MYRQLRTKVSADVSNAVLVVGVYEKTTQLPAGYQATDEQLGGAIAAAIARPEFSAAKGAITTVHPAQGSDKVYILGLGRNASELGEALRIAGSRLVKLAFTARVTSLAFDLIPGMGDQADLELAGRALGDGLAIGNFTFDAYKGLPAASGKKAGAADLSLTLVADRALTPHVDRALKVGESVNLARTLAATPPNVANPAYLVATCRQIARKTGLKCSIIDHKQAAKLGMGGLLAVGAAGSTPPAVIALEHKPRNAKGAPILLVGKAITFDTGGYSLKPAEAMDKMKYDKCGGMAVIGTMHALASLKVNQHVVGLIPTAENLVSDKGYRPGDILRFTNGVTSEITNTDAEGRLILADALAHGTKTYKPQAVIDLATLTGGVVVALGSHMAGLFANQDNLRDQLIAAGQFAGERLWHLPLWEEHRQQMKGIHGDLINSANREGSPIQGAAFLSYFIEPDGKQGLPTTPWAHLDIAGVADVKAEKGPFPVGPTGFGIRLLVRALENWTRID